MSEREEFRLDPNTADVEGLCQLPGVGPAMAERIMAARPFEGADDLMRVSGVGPTVLTRMRPFLLPSFAEGEGEAQEVFSLAAEELPAVAESLSSTS